MFLLTYLLTAKKNTHAHAHTLAEAQEHTCCPVAECYVYGLWFRQVRCPMLYMYIPIAARLAFLAAQMKIDGLSACR